MHELYAGVDVGSTAVRVGLIDESGTLKYVQSVLIEYHADKSDGRFITQSSDQIAQGLDTCLSKLQNQLTLNEKIVSVACSSTCSMALFKRVRGGLMEPYSAQKDFRDSHQNVVFWMDSRSESQTETINSACKTNGILDYYGGSLIAEMAIPKVKYLVEHIPKEDLDDIVFLDLHNYLSHHLLKDGKYVSDITISNEATQRGIDGELQGWNADLLKSIGLEQLTRNHFDALFTPFNHIHSKSTYHELPLAGTKIGTTSSGMIVSQGVIDSYAGWLGSCGSDIRNTLTMVAGTSTCFIIGHESGETTFKGVWGPFQGIVPDLFVSAGGLSTSGKLIEHLFESHPSFKDLPQENIFNELEAHIINLEKEKGANIHLLAKYVHTYGDLAGNRTPYCDSSMRGVFFGESLDLSITDLVFKYISILEFLAFQSKQFIDILRSKSLSVQKIMICGSQANNSRLVKLISNVTGVPVEIANISPDLSGVRGAAYLGYSGYHNLRITEVLAKFKEYKILIEPSWSDDKPIIKLLQKKFEILSDIAERQRIYKSWIDQVS